ncbi:unnamed protein product [Durusdinium trenchii]|uniref:Uncharacterized protein n=1 Tax=Durusdinium trenchii TaxID=1381693 RepID=A0ABP0NBU3_9DINO
MAWPLLGRNVAKKHGESKEVKLMPRLPLNGPSGQLRPDILIGKAGEFDLRCGPPVSSLPRIPATARPSFRTGHAERTDTRNCLSSRRRRSATQAGELARGLQRVDHVHRLQPLPEDGGGSFISSKQADDEWPDQSMLESLGVPEHAAALMAGTSSSRSLFSTTHTSSCASLTDSVSEAKEQRFSRSDADFSAWNFPPMRVPNHLFGVKGTVRSTPRQLSKAQSRRSLSSEVVVLRGESQPWVLDRIRACFQHSFAEVMARLTDLERALNAPQGEEDAEKSDKSRGEVIVGSQARSRGSLKLNQGRTSAGDIVSDAENLQAALDSAGLESWSRPGPSCLLSEVRPMLSKTSLSTHLNPLSESAASQDLAKVMESEDGQKVPMVPEEEIALSGDAEVSRSLDMLQFVRWLCGSTVVESNLHLEAVCNVLSEVLQPLQPPPGHRSSKLGDGHGPDLGQTLKHLLTSQMGQVSVLHCEGSLVDAVEQGLLAPHARPPQPVPQQPTQRHDTMQRVQQQGFRQRQVGFMQQKARLIEKQQTFIKDLENHQKEPKALEECGGNTMTVDDFRVKDDDVMPWQVDIFGPFQPMLQMKSDPRVDAVAQAKATCRQPESRSSSALCQGDPEGAFAVRRKLLSPSLRGFGACRRQDTCVLWTGSTVVGAGLQGCPANQVDAICYPPCGWVPAHLLCGWQTGWTIMPNSFRYGPTVQTSVQIWRVKIDFTDGMPSAVERQGEVLVKGLAIDCAAHGEPFCIIFWPNVMALEGIRSMFGLEVMVTGLTGPVSELSFYYQVAPFRLEDMQHKMLLEARRFSDLASQPRLFVDCSLPMEMPPRRLRRASEFQRKPLLQPMSHPSMDIVADGVDLLVTIRGCVPAVKAELHVVRFGGETDIVPRAAQAQRLPNWNFLIRVKIPLPRSKYQLRIKPDPMQDGASSLCYSVAFNESVKAPALLASLDEPLASKFGYAPFTSDAQAHGVILISPLMYRIPTGRAYFLVYVDKALALESDSIQALQSSSRFALFCQFDVLCGLFCGQVEVGRATSTIPS